MDPGAGPEIAGRGYHHLGGAGDRPESVIAGARAFVVVGKYGQNTVPDELVHMAGVLHDDRNHGLHVDIEEFHDDLGVFGFAEGGEAADIGEKDGDGPAFAGERDRLGDV